MRFGNERVRLGSGQHGHMAAGQEHIARHSDRNGRSANAVVGNCDSQESRYGSTLDSPRLRYQGVTPGRSWVGTSPRWLNIAESDLSDSGLNHLDARKLHPEAGSALVR